jgi:6-phosphogluconate dehydrogenase
MSFLPQKLDVKDKAAFIEMLRLAVYTACLASFIQGISIISAANRENKWSIGKFDHRGTVYARSANLNRTDYAAVWQIWRAGCIIQADYISDNILKPVFYNAENLDVVNLLTKSDKALQDLKSGFPKLKEVLAKATEADMVVPSLSATAEWIKIIGGTDLPTSFYEAQLDYFGNHMYDTKDDGDMPDPTEGKHHFEWKPASKK